MNVEYRVREVLVLDKKKRMQREKQLKQRQKQRQQLSHMWRYEVGQLLASKEELDRLYWQLEDVVNDRLVDSIIYEIKSQEARYDYHYQNLRMLEERTLLEADQEQVQDK